MTELTQYIPDEGTMLRFGKKLAEVLVKQPKDNAIVLYFNGDLGAGKTTLTRGMVQRFRLPRQCQKSYLYVSGRI